MLKIFAPVLLVAAVLSGCGSEETGWSEQIKDDFAVLCTAVVDAAKQPTDTYSTADVCRCTVEGLEALHTEEEWLAMDQMDRDSIGLSVAIPCITANA